MSTSCYRGGVQHDGRPEVLEAWMKFCEVVDVARVALNRDLQREAEVTLAESLVLCQVAMAPGGRLRMVDIAGLLTIGKSAVTKTVDRLEQRGLLVRERDRADRRTVHATLTDEGARVFDVAQPAFVGAVIDHFASPLSESELHQLGTITEKVLRLHRAVPTPMA